MSPSNARLERIADSLRQCSDVVLEATGEQELLDRFCHVLVEVCGYRLAWVGYAEDDEERTVRPAAKAGEDEGYLESVDVRWSEDVAGQGPTGRAIVTAEPVTSQSVATDPRLAPWRARAARWGLASSAALPLLVDQRVIGALNIYAADPNAFDEDELALVRRLAGHLAFGIARLRAAERRVHAEHEAREKTELLRALYAASPDMIFLHDVTGRMIGMNDKAVDFIGMSREELLAARPEQLMGGGHTPQEAFAYLTRALAGEAIDVPWVTRTAEGDEVPTEVRLRRLDLDHQPGSPSVVAIVRNMTDRQRAEREARNVEKLHALGVMAGGIAHDFNNLLTGVTGNLSIALRRELSAEVAPLLSSAMQASERASALTKQLLAFAKGGNSVPRALELSSLTEEAAQFAARGTAVAITSEGLSELGTVVADPDQISRVLHNLVLNAVQAMPDGGTIRLTGGRVEIGADNPLDLPAGCYARLDVSDDGPGIDEALAGRIFDPYFTTKEGGSGLGLAASFSIMRAHGGHLCLAPSSDGSRFELYLPVSDEQEAAITSDSQPRRRTGSGRILLMDDQQIVRGTLSRILTAEGYEVVAVEEGRAAIDAYGEALEAEAPFEAVILDLTVPGAMGGREALERLLEIDPGVRAIASTGYSDEGSITGAFTGFLPKPYRSDDVLAVLASVLRAERS